MPRAGVLAIGAVVAVCAAAAGAVADASSPSPSRLQRFDGCRSLDAYMRAHALPVVGVPGLESGVAIGAQPPARGRAASQPAFSPATGTAQELSVLAATSPAPPANRGLYAP